MRNLQDSTDKYTQALEKRITPLPDSLASIVNSQINISSLWECIVELINNSKCHSCYINIFLIGF